MSCANRLVVDVMPKLLQLLFEELWRARYKEQQEDVKNFTDKQKCGHLLANGLDGATTNPSDYAIKKKSIRRQALSGRLDRLDATAWGYILLESAHDAGGECLGLIHAISDAKLQKDIKDRIEFIFGIYIKINTDLVMSLDDLGQMINNLLRFVGGVRDYCWYLYTAAEQSNFNDQVCKGRDTARLSHTELTRLKTKANGMILECKREIEMILFWKERQHLVVQKMEVL